MHRLEQEFGNDVDFFHFNVDIEAFDQSREDLGLFRRSTYILLDPAGNELQTWIGFLDQEVLLEQIGELLAQQEAG